MMTTHITTQSQLTKIPLIEMRNVCVLFPDGSARIKYPYLNLSYIYAYRRVWEFNGHFVSVAYVVELVSSHMSHTQRTYVRNGPNFKFCLTLRPFSTLEDQSIFKTVRSTVYILDLQLRCMCVLCRIPTRCIHTNEARCLRAINKFRVFDILTLKHTVMTVGLITTKIARQNTLNHRRMSMSGIGVWRTEEAPFKRANEIKLLCDCMRELYGF